MSSEDGSGADPSGLSSAINNSEEVDTQLVEALVHLLLEKGVITKNDSLSIVQTVAQIQQGNASEGGPNAARARASAHMLHRMYRSFEALPERAGVRPSSGTNILQLRRPVYGDDAPEFPAEE